MSGGRDSTALLHCTARQARLLGGRVHALHVHHGLHPDADRWQRHVADQCRRWARAGLPVTLHVRRLDGSPLPGDSVEAWARRERYRALAEMAAAAGCGAVLLAHHRGDQAETVLLQLLRGAGARGLAAMPAAVERGGIAWVRPWLAQPRRAIESYVARHRLRWVDDASNDEPRYARNRLRAQVWPSLEAAFPDAASALAAAAMRAAEEAACAGELASIDAAVCLNVGGALCVRPWLALSGARRANLLRHWLSLRLGRGAPETLLQRLLAELPDARNAIWPAPDASLRLYRGRLMMQSVAGPAALAGSARARDDAGQAPAEDMPPVDVHRPGRHVLPGWPGTLVVQDAASGGIAVSRLRAVSVTPRRAGDRFQAHAGGPPRSLKKQFQSAGVPAHLRHGPLLRDAGGTLLFVAGLGVDARGLAPAGRPQRTVSWEPAAGR